jgi:hypothetical protein
VVPGFNDSDEELWQAADFLASVSRDIPWHVTAFHKDYKMTDPDNTPAQTLLRAATIGKEAGLRYIYAGNLPGRVRNLESTFCPACGELVVERLAIRSCSIAWRRRRCPDARQCPRRCGHRRTPSGGKGAANGDRAHGSTGSHQRRAGTTSGLAECDS